MGENEQLSTQKYFNDEGIVDRKKHLSFMNNKLGITKVARPYRAVADMVVMSILNNKRTDHIEINSWLVTKDEREKFLKLLILAKKHSIPVEYIMKKIFE